MKVVLFWLFHWWREVLRLPKSLLSVWTTRKVEILHELLWHRTACLASVNSAELATLLKSNLCRLMIILSVGFPSILLAGNDSYTCTDDKGINPTYEEINTKIMSLARQFRIPPILIKAIAYHETRGESGGWIQYYEESKTISCNSEIIDVNKGDTIKRCEMDGREGLGMMQVTVTTDDLRYDCLKKSWKFNLEQGVKTLEKKWVDQQKYSFNTIFDKPLLENWYYPVYWYNGKVDSAITYVNEAFRLLNKDNAPPKLAGYWDDLSDVKSPYCDDDDKGTCLKINLKKQEMYTPLYLMKQSTTLHFWKRNSSLIHQPTKGDYQSLANVDDYNSFVKESRVKASTKLNSRRIFAGNAIATKSKNSKGTVIRGLKNVPSIVTDGVGKSGVYDWLLINWGDVKGWSALTDIDGNPILSKAKSLTVESLIDDLPVRNIVAEKKQEIKAKTMGTISGIRRQIPTNDENDKKLYDWVYVKWETGQEGWVVADGLEYEGCKTSLESQKGKSEYANLMKICTVWQWNSLDIRTNNGLLGSVGGITNRSSRQTRDSKQRFMTRAEFVALVSLALNVENLDDFYLNLTSVPFDDVSLDNNFLGYIQYAKEQGFYAKFTTECKPNNFCPDNFVTREEALNVIFEAFKFSSRPAASQKVSGLFTDLGQSSSAPLIYTARNVLNLLHGYSDKTFRPTEYITHDHAVKAVCIATFGASECIASGDKNLPMVLAVTPRKATVGQSVTLSVDGFKLPMPSVTMTLLGCDNLTPISGGTENKQQFICTPSKAGNLTGQVKDVAGTVLFEFPLNVTAAATQGTPVPDITTPVTPTNPPDTTKPTTEPGGAAENPGDATQLFILDGQMTSTCTFEDVDQTSVFAEAVRALCSAGILVGYWENGKRVFVKLDPNNPTAARNLPGNKNLKATLGEVLKVFMFSVDYDYFSARHDPTSKTWYTLFTNEAVARGLNLNGLVYSDDVTREQAMTWLAQLFYRYTDNDPIGFLVGKKLIDGSRPTEAINRYELALFTYRAILDTGRTNTIPFGLWGEPASLPQPLGTEISAKALTNVGKLYPYTDGKYTYCARFVRMMFDEQAIWGDAKSMCNHYANMMQTSQTPPAGAVLCYAPNASNYNYGHVAIAVGDGTEVGATSLKNGVTKRNSVYGSAYQGWIDATTFSNNYPQ